MTFTLEETIRKLEAYQNVTYPILSLYINTYHQDHPKMLKNFRRLVIDYLTDEEQEMVKKNISYIMAFLEVYATPQTCKTVAIFSGGDHLWEIITTDLHFPEQIAISHSPFIRPLQEIINEHKNYLVVLADKDRALLLKIHEGMLESQKEIHERISPEEVPAEMTGRNKNMRAGLKEQHERDHLYRHFEHIGREIDHILENDHIAGILIGGHKQFIHPIEEHCSKETRDKIIGEFIANLNSPLPTLLQQSTKALSNYTNHQMSSPLLSK